MALKIIDINHIYQDNILGCIDLIDNFIIVELCEGSLFDL